MHLPEVPVFQKTATFPANCILALIMVDEGGEEVSRSSKERGLTDFASSKIIK